MAADNLQTVIISKDIAKTREAAAKVAREFANRIYTSRETKTSWRFRQRPPDDFRKGTFRTKKIQDGISLVYGTLKASAKKKKKRNPDTYTEEVRFMYAMERRIKGAENVYDLAKLAKEVELIDLASPNVRRHILNILMDKAKRLKIKPRRYKNKGEEYRDIYFETLLETPTQSQVELFENPPKKKAKKKAKKKRAKTPRHTKLRSPKVMPDPGPSSWCGSILEWKWKNGKKEEQWKSGRKYWLFLWSVKYKAIVAIPCPPKTKVHEIEKEWRKLEKVSRTGGAAKMFERFMEREPDATYEGEIPAVKLIKLGEGKEVIYRSNKWIQQLYKKHAPSVIQGKQQDYFHCINEGFKRTKKLPKGAQIYCGPSLDNPEVFLCFGGKLTMTERGLVF